MQLRAKWLKKLCAGAQWLCSMNQYPCFLSVFLHRQLWKAVIKSSIEPQCLQAWKDEMGVTGILVCSIILITAGIP